MSKTTVHPKRSTRQQRGIALFRERGEEIEHVEGWRWRVPSYFGSGAYLVDLHAECRECPGRAPEGEVCKHTGTAIIARAKSADCPGCGKKIRRRHLWPVPEDHLKVWIRSTSERCQQFRGPSTAQGLLNLVWATFGSEGH